MKMFYNQSYDMPEALKEDYRVPSLQEDLEKTRQALDIAYAGFDNAVDADLIDCYIYEINALLKRYKYLANLIATEADKLPEDLYQKTPVRSLVSHVFS